MADDRYDKTTHDGKTVDKMTKAALEDCEKILGYDLSIVQGSYHGGVSASAGTHDGGGVVDLLAWDHERKVRVLREVGFAAWYRPTITGLWNEHIHAVLIGNAKAAPSALNQVTAYRNHRDGLKSNAADNTWHPDPITAYRYQATATPKPEKKRHPKQFFVDVHPKYQRGFDFKKAAAEGIRGVVIKCTEGRTVAYGDLYDEMVQGALDAGLSIGVYHWLRADSFAAPQAIWLAENIGDKRFSVWVDVEKGTGGDKPQAPQLRLFYAAAEAEGLNVHGSYLPEWYWSDHMGYPNLPDDKRLWNSVYWINANATPRVAYRLNFKLRRWSAYGGQKPTFLQFGSRVKVAGMNVDCNVFRGPRRDFRELFFTPGDEPAPTEPVPDPVPVEPATWVPINIGTYNLGGEATREDVVKLLALVDVLCLQESADQLDALESHEGWTLVWGTQGRGRRKTALLVRDTIVEQGLIEATPRTKVGPKGAGPSWTDWKYLTAVKIREDSVDRALNIASTHLISSVQGKATPWRMVRRVLYRRHIKAITDWVEERSGHGLVFVCGDFNATPDFDDLSPLPDAGLEPATAKSHGGKGKDKRAIDYVWWKTQSKVRLVKVEALDGYGSDHRPVVATFSVQVGKS